MKNTIKTSVRGTLYSLTLLGVLAVIGPACAPNYTGMIRRQTEEVEKYARRGDYSRFLEKASDLTYYKSSRNKLLKSLDIGIALTLSGEYEKGAKRLAKVGDLAEKYYTKSILRHMASVMANDLTLPYYGTEYEVAFAANISALSYAAAGKSDDALAEIRRIEHNLAVMSDAAGESGTFLDDAFSHYLAGMLYEELGMLDDARISYVHAESSYGGRFFPVRPRGLAKAMDRIEEKLDCGRRHNMLSTDSESAIPDNTGVAAAENYSGMLSGNAIAPGVSDSSGTQDSGDSESGAISSVVDGAVEGIVNATKYGLKNTLGRAFGVGGQEDSGETEPQRHLIVCAATGRGPIFEESVQLGYFSEEDEDHIIKIALPELITRRSSIRRTRVKIGDASHPLECVADYRTIATQSFYDKQDVIYAKTMARASAHYLMVLATKQALLEDLEEDYEEAVEDEDSSPVDTLAASIAITIASAAIEALAYELLEHADTRSSLLLPEKLWCARVPLPEDSDSLSVTLEYLDDRGSVIDKETRMITTSGEHDETVPTAVFGALW